MVSLSDGKTIGGIGAILVLLSFIPSIGGVVGIAGFIMVLVGVKYIADYLHEGKIFNNMIGAVVLAIGGIAVGSIIVLGTVLTAFQNNYFGTNLTPSASITTAQWTTFGVELGLGLFVAWIFFLLSAVFLRRSYKAIGSRLNVGVFGTAGTLYLIGAATTIIGIGFLILLVAQIVTAVAFFSIPTQPLQQVPAPVASAPRSTP
jgi:uncharacterized membrane protein